MEIRNREERTLGRGEEIYQDKDKGRGIQINAARQEKKCSLIVKGLLQKPQGDEEKLDRDKG